MPEYAAFLPCISSCAALISRIDGRDPQVDPYTQSEVQKSLMLERFQEENPGFDFSGASFNGQVPDPKTFMGGVGYK